MWYSSMQNAIRLKWEVAMSVGEAELLGHKDTLGSIMNLPDEIGDMPPTHWAEFAGAYDSIMDLDPAMIAIRRAVVERIPVGAGRILDLGCGTGALIYLLRQDRRGEHYVAVDPEQNMLDVAQSKLRESANVAFLIGRGEAIPVDDASVDYVVSNFSLHHIPNDRKANAAREIFRVLRPGGHLVFGDQYCKSYGKPGDKAWAREVLETYVGKAYHYLEHASYERMLLQMKILPRMLAADGEHLVPEAFWVDILADAGMTDISVTPMLPATLMNRVIVARRPD